MAKSAGSRSTRRLRSVGNEVHAPEPEQLGCRRPEGVPNVRPLPCHGNRHAVSRCYESLQVNRGEHKASRKAAVRRRDSMRGRRRAHARDRLDVPDRGAEDRSVIDLGEGGGGVWGRGEGGGGGGGGGGGAGGGGGGGGRGGEGGGGGGGGGGGREGEGGGKGERGGRGGGGGGERGSSCSWQGEGKAKFLREWMCSFKALERGLSRTR